MCEVGRQRGDKAKGTWNRNGANGEIFFGLLKFEMGDGRRRACGIDGFDEAKCVHGTCS